MVSDGESCPLDDSRLVYLAGSYGEHNVDLSVCYCPRCDVAMVYLSKAQARSTPSPLQWHRHGDQLELREQDRKSWGKLPRPFREEWEANIRQRVKQFLDGRFSETVRCPLDGVQLTVLHRWDEAGVLPWLLAWCRDCGMGFLFARDADYGWEHAADVTWDAARNRFVLGEVRETGGNHEVNPDLLRDLGFPSVPGAPGRSD